MPTSALYDPNTLLANRQGRLTPYQRQTFIETNVGSKGALLGVPFALVIIGVIAVSFGDRLETLEGAAVVLPMLTLVVVLVACVLIGNRVASIPARLRMNHAKLEARRGEVVFDAGRYVAKVGSQTLRPLYASADLLPGNYVFYCLRGSNWLFSAEKEADFVSAQTQPELPASPLTWTPSPQPLSFDLNTLRDALRQTNGFDEYTLALNRRGEMTDAQKQWLGGSRRGDLRTAVIVALLGIVLFAINFIFQTGLDAETLLGGAAFFVLFSGYFVYRWWAQNADARSAVVQTAEGAVTKLEQRTEDSSTYTHYYVINGIRLEVGEAAYHALIDQVVYRVYYLPRSRQLLSIEPVP